MRLRLSLQEAIALGVVIFLLLTALFGFLVWRPQLAALRKIAQQQQEEKKKAESAALTLARLQKIKQEAPKIEAELIQLSRRMPEEVDIPSLIIELQELASESGLEFSSFTPSQPTAVGDFSALNLTLSLNGYFNKVSDQGGSLLDFLYRLEHFPREIIVTNLNLGGGSEGLPSLSISIQAQTFVYTPGGAGEESQQAQQ
jgi:Tfp pilus assembly protein PilO